MVQGSSHTPHREVVFLFGSVDSSTAKVLSRLGYEVLVLDGSEPFHVVLSRKTPDILVIDERGCSEAGEIIDFCSSMQELKRLSVIVLVQSNELMARLAEKSLKRLTIIRLPASSGVLASKVATELRLRKMTGLDESASLAESNLALRDLTSRFRKELEEAREIQQSLLPQSVPKGAGFEVATLFRPLEEVGGDWYFAQKNKQGQVVLHVADVTGHGLAAALVCSMTKLALAASAHQPPGLQMAAANSMLTPLMPQGRFVTLGTVSYDPSSRKLVTARAGHPPVVVVRPALKSFELLQPEGFPLGFFEEGEYPVSETILEEGDIAILLSDGITEAQSRGKEIYGHERLAQSLVQAPQKTAQGCLDKMMQAFESFLDGRGLKDDVTAVLLVCTGK